MKIVRMIALAFAIIAAVSTAKAQVVTGDCPLVFPDGFAAVAPGQPAVEERSTIGVINALCDVTLNLVGCKFFPNAISLMCDSNADAIPDVVIELQDVTIVNSLLVRARLVPLSPQLPGTAFPLTCCGGVVDVVISRIEGSSIQSFTCQTDLGLRAPVVISASPSEGDCANEQNLIVPGSCFLLADGSPNVTSVFAVERGNPQNVIQSKRFVILNTNLIDALFDFGDGSAGKTFLIFASGPNGTSRNLVALPEGAPEGCPLGNEQGIQVTFTCRTSSGSGGSGGGGVVVDPVFSVITSCTLQRNATGGTSLILNGSIMEGATFSVGGMQPKKAKFKNRIEGEPFYSKVQLKGKFCNRLPGTVEVVNPNGQSSPLFQCGEICR